MIKVNRDFKGIWIPKEIWLSKDLTMMEKVFLVEIDSLDNKDGCFASNSYFAGFFNVTPQRCSQIINSLIQKKIIKAMYIREGKEIVKRVVNILNTYKGKFNKVSNKCEEGIKKSLTRYKENVKDNNTINNTSNKLINNKPDKSGATKVISLYTSLLKENHIMYKPANSEYITFHNGYKKYSTEGMPGYFIEDAMKRWFSEKKGSWCGYAIRNFWNDIGKMQIKDSKKGIGNTVNEILEEEKCKKKN